MASSAPLYYTDLINFALIANVRVDGEQRSGFLTVGLTVMASYGL